MIKFKNVSFDYGDDENKINALKDISLTIEDGEFVAILGHNGSGKSTLARLINGLLAPSRGEVLVGGTSTVDSSAVWRIRQQVGMVFQNPDNQIIASRVEEDVAFGPENLGCEPAEIRARVDEALAVVGMRELAHSDPHLLSGGQKQRVAIAGALAMRPKYLVFDEATSMLDPKGREEIVATTRRLNSDYGITIIFITHIPEEAALAGRVVVLSGGTIAMDGTPQAVFSDVDAAAALGIGVPKARLLAHGLERAGIDIPGSILTVDDLVAALC
jgi:energy-coupling factor transport system ATP-binding protein